VDWILLRANQPQTKTLELEGIMIGYGSGLEVNDELKNKSERLKYFEIAGPKGGHYNDGFKLTLSSKYDSFKALEADLLALGINFNIVDENSPLPNSEYRIHSFKLNYRGDDKVLYYFEHQELLSFKAYLRINQSYLEVNLNQSSPYCITMSDILAALKIEEFIDRNSNKFSLSDKFTAARKISRG
jgi:hypothetical protein